MSLEIKKEGRETSQNLVRRFSRRMKQSCILLRARRSRFWEKEKSPQMKKRSALSTPLICRTLIFRLDPIQK